MSRQTLKDAHYHVIGYIDTASNGDQTARDAHFHILGYYNANGNQTKDAHYHVIGYGNLLGSLIGGR